MADSKASQQAPDRSAAALRALLDRHSIGRTGEPAPTDEELTTLFECAGRAPDHGSLRPTRYLVVRGSARERLGEVLAAAQQRRQPSTSPEVLDRERAKPLRAPLLVVVVSRLRDDVAAVPPLEQLVSSGVSAGYLLLAAHALGYGAMWRTGWPASDPLVRAALGLSPGEAVVGFLYLGTPPGDREGPPARSGGGAAQRVDEWSGPRVEIAGARSEADSGHAEIGLGPGAQAGGPPLAVELEDHALALAEHPKYRALQSVGGQGQVGPVGITDHDPLAGGGVEGLDHPLHRDGPPGDGAPSAPR